MAELVKLKNGSEEHGPLVSTIVYTLRELMREGNGIVVYELVELCKDAEHELWGKTGVQLKECALVEQNGTGWKVHSAIRNIVLSAATGKGMDLTIGDPVDRTTPAAPNGKG